LLPSWPVPCGLQAEAGGSAVRWSASTDLTGWQVLHFTFESAWQKPQPLESNN
jgi:hypothetical protein